MLSRSIIISHLAMHIAVGFPMKNTALAHQAAFLRGPGVIPLSEHVATTAVLMSMNIYTEHAQVNRATLFHITVHSLSACQK